MTQEGTGTRRGPWIVVAVVVVLAAVGVGTAFLVRTAGDSGEAPATASTTTTTEQPPRFAPLTGEPTDAEPQRVVAVKVDAAPNVTRFSGLERADLVYEVLVEGGITRQMVLFESEEADRVGPVRSLRTSDFDLVENLGDPIVVFSGADDLTLGAALAALDTPFTEGSPGSEDAFRRDTSLRAPHNLFVSTTAVREAVGEPGTVRRPFTHGAGPAGAPVAGVRIAFSRSTVVEFRWDEDRGEWLRTKDGRAQTDDGDVQLGVDSVLVLDSEYTSPPWDPTSPQLESVGEGGGLLLGDGVLTPVRWSRANPLLPFTLTDAAGAEVALPPGRTWVAFPPPGVTSSVPAPEGEPPPG
jgi:hypothetical protein